MHKKKSLTRVFYLKSTQKKISLFLLCIIVLLFTAIGSGCAKKATYAEFPFSLTYKLAGETITVNNTYVCEYTGIGWDTGRGFYKKWIGYVKETGLENVLIIEDSERQIFCQVGDPRYYMENGDNLYWETESLSPPHLYAVKKSNEFDHISVDQIKEIYDIEIISWSFSEPMVND